MTIPPRRSDHIMAVLTLATVVAVALICAMVNAQLVYGDWSCAFAHCVKEKT